MANSIFDQTVLNVRERPLSSDLNQAQSQLYRTLRALLRYQFSRTPTANGVSVVQSGFIGDSFQVYADAVPSLNLFVRDGIGFMDNAGDSPTDIGSVVGVDDRERYKPLALDTVQTLVVPAADPTNPRVDIVEVQYDRRLENPLSRDVFNPISPFNFVATLVNKTLAWIQDGRTSINGAAKINYKSGTPAGVPVAPALTAGYIKLAEVYVPATSTAISVLRDTRKIVSPYGRAYVRLALSIPHTAATPTVVAFAATPGVKAYVKNVVAGAFAIYVLPGSVPTNVVVTTAAQYSPVVENLNVQPASIGTLTAPEIALLASTTAPAFSNGYRGADRILLECAFNPFLVAAGTCYLDISWDYV